MKLTSVTLQATLDDYHWLTGNEAGHWLARCAADAAPLHAQAASLRRELSAERTHLILEQVELRRRGRVKFAAAEQMFFTRTGLEQASDEFVAQWKARRMPSGDVADLCCGIGGDLRAFTQRGRAVGVERDPRIAALAAANCRALDPTTSTNVLSRDAEQFAVGEVAAWHIDPDRRPQGRRTTRVELHEPSTAALDSLLQKNPAAAIKLAPAAELPANWPADAELEWISRDRQCRQLVAWFGPLAKHPGQRRATVLFDDARPPRTFLGAADAHLPTAPALGRFLYEPDPAVLAADLTAALAAEHQLAAIAPNCAYLTSDQPVSDAALASFEVEEVLPFQPKRLKQIFRARNVGRLEVKKRGVSFDPEVVRKQLAGPGDASATLLLARVDGTVTAIVARRLTTG